MFTNRFDYLYVEPSTYCNLKCPRCPRTESPETYDLEHLKPETLQKVLSSQVWQSLETIEYGGNYGDPIMHPNLGELIATARSIHPTAQHLIHTSGNRDQKYWNKVLDQLTSTDRVLFSIDGLFESNTNYRVGARWEWIEQALGLCAGRVQIFWKFIVFSHNENQIGDVIQYAKQMGVSHFLLTKSHLFNNHWRNDKGVDPMAPAESWIAKSPEKGAIIDPKCQTRSMHYLAASGLYSPCCWANAKAEMRFSMDDSFDGVLEDPKLLQLKKTWNKLKPSICAKKCRANLSKRSSHQQVTLDLAMPESQLMALVEDFRTQ